MNAVALLCVRSPKDLIHLQPQKIIIKKHCRLLIGGRGSDFPLLSSSSNRDLTSNVFRDQTQPSQSEKCKTISNHLAANPTPNMPITII
jgi:hypothetical protein